MSKPLSPSARIRARRAERAAKRPAKAAPAVSPLAPSGFPDLPSIDGLRFSAVAAGVRYTGRTDLMLAEIAPGATIAGTFTRSATRAAPVRACERHLAALAGKTAKKPIGILVNSGNANAFTGQLGETAVQASLKAAADALDTETDLIFPASTGVIGEPLAHERITASMKSLVQGLTPDGAKAAARAIMTTDTFPKGASRSVEVGGGTVTITGFAKGSGMIAPDMATMLVYIFTDAKIGGKALQSCVSGACDRTFNAITVDSDTSTSDTLLVAATGRGPKIAKADTPAFGDALEAVMRDLAHQVVRDGEGATKFIEVAVTGAANDTDADKVARAIANSPLVKTAFAGEDPNWGRIVMAIGKSGAQADRDQITIHFGDILVAEKGWVAATYSEEAGAAYMRGEDLRVSVDLGLKSGKATVWTCDLTHGYISINADYRS